MYIDPYNVLCCHIKDYKNLKVSLADMSCHHVLTNPGAMVLVPYKDNAYRIPQHLTVRIRRFPPILSIQVTYKRFDARDGREHIGWMQWRMVVGTCHSPRFAITQRTRHLLPAISKRMARRDWHIMHVRNFRGILKKIKKNKKNNKCLGWALLHQYLVLSALV